MELADTQVLGTCAYGREGSTPSGVTKDTYLHYLWGEIGCEVVPLTFPPTHNVDGTLDLYRSSSLAAWGLASHLCFILVHVLIPYLPQCARQYPTPSGS